MTKSVEPELGSISSTTSGLSEVATAGAQPARRATSKLSDLIGQKDLLFAWTMRTIRARYKQSLLGGFWAVLQPAATAIMFSIIFTFFVPVNTGGIPYIVFSYVAMVPWTFFTSSVSDMIDSLVGNMGLVSKIYFPREILPTAALLARMLDFVVAGTVLVLLMLIFRMQILSWSLLFLPLVFLVQVALALGLGFMGAALNVFLRDVRHVVALGLQIWFYASPIIYPVTSVPEQLQPFYFLNPMAGVIEAYRSILLYHRLPDYHLAVAGVISAIVLVVGYWIFKRLEPQFADVV